MTLELFLGRYPRFYIKNSVEFSLSSYADNYLPPNSTLHRVQQPARMVYALKEMLAWIAALNVEPKNHAVIQS